MCCCLYVCCHVCNCPLHLLLILLLPWVLQVLLQLLLPMHVLQHLIGFEATCVVLLQCVLLPLHFVCAAAQAAAIVHVIVACAVAIHVARVVAVHVAYAVNVNKVQLACLKCSDSGGPKHFSVILCILLTAHCSLKFDEARFVALLQMLLPVKHVAPSCAVDTLTGVHVQCLHAFDKRAKALLQVIGFSANCLVPTPNGDVVGNGLACICTVVYSHLEPGGEAHHISGQNKFAVPSFLVLSGVWQQVQHCPSLQPYLWHQIWQCPLSSW